MFNFLIVILSILIVVFGDEKLKLDEHNVKNKEHLSDHAKDESMKKPVSEMTDDELEFFYFHEHDKDHNKLLDGNEIFMSIIEHFDHDQKHNNSTKTEEQKFTEQDIQKFLINIFEVDKNNDGYLDLNEFRKIYRGKDD